MKLGQLFYLGLCSWVRKILTVDTFVTGLCFGIIGWLYQRLMGLSGFWPFLVFAFLCGFWSFLDVLFFTKKSLWAWARREQGSTNSWFSYQLPKLPAVTFFTNRPSYTTRFKALLMVIHRLSLYKGVLFFVLSAVLFCSHGLLWAFAAGNTVAFIWILALVRGLSFRIWEQGAQVTDRDHYHMMVLGSVFLSFFVMALWTLKSFFLGDFILTDILIAGGCLLTIPLGFFQIDAKSPLGVFAIICLLNSLFCGALWYSGWCLLGVPFLWSYGYESQKNRYFMS